jgi:hypothetical protein
MSDHTKKGRKPYPSVRRPRKTVFTPAIWARWMVENGWLSAQMHRPFIWRRCLVSRSFATAWEASVIRRRSHEGKRIWKRLR